MSGERGVRNQM